MQSGFWKKFFTQVRKPPFVTILLFRKRMHNNLKVVSVRFRKVSGCTWSKVCNFWTTLLFLPLRVCNLMRASSPIIKTSRFNAIHCNRLSWRNKRRANRFETIKSVQLIQTTKSTSFISKLKKGNPWIYSGHKLNRRNITKNYMLSALFTA